MSKRKNNNANKLIGGVIAIAIIAIASYLGINIDTKNTNNVNTNISTYSTNEQSDNISASLTNIPEYSNNPYIIINNNNPSFSEEEKKQTNSFENYSELDGLGRCGVAFANICKETMPPEGDERGDISSVKPTGWKQAKYNGEYLYNRCHLIGYQLSDEDANKKNLITGTRYFNVEGMLPFENKVAEYIKENNSNHVLYKVTPIFEGNNLLAKGVQMEAYSVEDEGKRS